MEALGEVELWLHASSLAHDAGEYSVSRFGRFNLGKLDPSTHSKRGVS
jgi:hypothetical protein